MKLLILEGIATSGKSTVISSIKEQLQGLNVGVAGESETHIPIMQQTNNLHIKFFEDLVNQMVASKPDLIIFDRLYLTQAYRAGAALAQYSGLESMLSKLGAITGFLRVDTNAIANRIAKAAEHRDATWGTYIKTKGNSIDEIAGYYIAQQQNQMNLLGMSSLPNIVCDTTNHNYAEVTKRILEKLKFQ